MCCQQKKKNMLDCFCGEWLPHGIDHFFHGPPPFLHTPLIETAWCWRLKSGCNFRRMFSGWLSPFSGRKTCESIARKQYC
nr:MAG TPA: hypothetical protein [Caudoviricetes sp.]